MKPAKFSHVLVRREKHFFQVNVLPPLQSNVCWYQCREFFHTSPLASVYSVMVFYFSPSKGEHCVRASAWISLSLQVNSKRDRRKSNVACDFFYCMRKQFQVHFAGHKKEKLKTLFVLRWQILLVHSWTDPIKKVMIIKLVWLMIISLNACVQVHCVQFSGWFFETREMQTALSVYAIEHIFSFV